MTVQNAYKVFKNEPKLAGLVVQGCYEYKDRFVFHAIPAKYLNTKDADKILGCSYAVMKSDGSIGRFRATDLPIAEYKRGKRITIFDHK